MKKFLLCMVLAGLMMPVIAQEKLAQNKMYTSHISEGMDLGISGQGVLPMNLKGTLVDVDGWKSAGTSDGYDRQTQGSVYPTTQIHTDGFIGVTWTNEDNLPFGSGSTQIRGVGYSFSKDGGKTWETPDMRVGGIPLYWPSYAQWGPTGEAILARSADTFEYEGMEIMNGLVLMTREKKGEGKWNLATVPYPEGSSHIPNGGYVMAWARMATSGDNHQYIHIMSPMSTPTTPNQPYKGYTTPTFYYRTQDGGSTWDIEGLLVPEMVGQTWRENTSYSDVISFAVQGNTVACSFIRFGMLDDYYVLKSLDNGDTWTCKNFFYSNVGYHGDPSESIDTVYLPTRGCIALDLDGKIHLAFGVSEATNNEQEGYITMFSGFLTSFFSYWNEDMEPIDGDIVFLRENLDDLFDDYFDWAQSENGSYWVNSTVPKWPIIGFYTPTKDENIFTVDPEVIRDWGGKSYGYAGGFSFPQMAFDADNKLHVAYLGWLDGGGDDGRWYRHPYYTTRTEDEVWSQTEYLVNTVDLIDKEFAYLTLAGLYNDKMHLVAQIDPSAGLYLPHSNQTSDHNPTLNQYYYFYIDNVPTPIPPVSINEVDYTPLTMSVFPNPASGQATVKLDGRKGNVTVYNMLGQTVYHVENVENSATIPLTMATGVYFVTVRSGNAMATQKLIVK